MLVRLGEIQVTADAKLVISTPISSVIVLSLNYLPSRTCTGFPVVAEGAMRQTNIQLRGCYGQD